MSERLITLFGKLLERPVYRFLGGRQVKVGLQSPPRERLVGHVVALVSSIFLALTLFSFAYFAHVYHLPSHRMAVIQTALLFIVVIGSNFQHIRREFWQPRKLFRALYH